MTTHDDEAQLAALLEYDDGPGVVLPLGDIVRAGRRRRHRRRAGVAAGGAVVLAVGSAAGIATWAGRRSVPDQRLAVGASPSGSSAETRSGLPATVEQSDQLLTDHPPTDPPTTITTGRDGWRAVAYVDTAGALCFGSVDASGASRGACGDIGGFGDGPLADNADGPDLSAAATASGSEAPAPGEIGVFGMVTTAEAEPADLQHVARVVVQQPGGTATTALLSPTAADLGSTARLAADERVWFAWLPQPAPGAALRVVTYTADGAFTGSQPLFLTPHDTAVWRRGFAAPAAPNG